MSVQSDAATYPHEKGGKLNLIVAHGDLVVSAYMLRRDSRCFNMLLSTTNGSYLRCAPPTCTSRISKRKQNVFALNAVAAEPSVW